MLKNEKEKKKQKKKNQRNGLSPIIFFKVFKGILIQAYIVEIRTQILLHLLPAKWYTFQPESWYIIQPVLTDACSQSFASRQDTLIFQCIKTFNVPTGVTTITDTHFNNDAAIKF